MIQSQLQQSPPVPPGIFMSLTCAEFYWKQMLNFLAQHVQAVEGLASARNM